MIKQCSICGKEFNAQNPLYKYCSNTCRETARKEKAKSYNKQYRFTHKEYFKEYRKKHKDRIKQTNHDRYIGRKLESKFNNCPYNCFSCPYEDCTIEV